MKLLILCITLACGLASGATESDDASTVFVAEPQDAWVRPGDTVQLDCELAASSQADICAWRLAGTNLGVDHFYNVAPPDKVRALFPEHERVCSVLIEDADWRHDGTWTCWPLATTSHVSSRDARLIVTDRTSPVPTSSEGTTTVKTTPKITTWEPTPETTTREPTPETTTSGTTYIPTTTPEDTTTERASTTPEPATSTSPAPPTTTSSATTTEAPPTTTEGPTSPSPEFVCPYPNGLFADPSDDRYFYYCQDGMAVHMQCESPKSWDDTRKTCV